MATVIRSEISKHNKYWIDRNRYYELKHFCMQYPIWKKIVNSIDGYASSGDIHVDGSFKKDPVEKAAIKRDRYIENIDLVENCAALTDPVIGKYILTGIVEACSYEVLKTRFNIPCCKDIYYELYRKFFWILNEFRH